MKSGTPYQCHYCSGAYCQHRLLPVKKDRFCPTAVIEPSSIDISNSVLLWFWENLNNERGRKIEVNIAPSVCMIADAKRYKGVNVASGSSFTTIPNTHSYGVSSLRAM